jgi:hypothetical protein
MTKHSTIQDDTLNILFKYATTRGDNFRQWFYPNLPKAYDINADVWVLMDEGITKGLNAQEVADSIYKTNA